MVRRVRSVGELRLYLKPNPAVPTADRLLTLIAKLEVLIVTWPKPAQGRKG